MNAVPVADVASRYDPAGFGLSLARVGAEVARRPLTALGATARLAGALAGTGVKATVKALGWQGAPAADSSNGDRRFSDPAWDHHPWFFTHKQAHSAWSRWLTELSEISDLDEHEAEKSKLAVETLSDAVAPTNFLVTNPKALRRAFQSGGASVLAGFDNYLDDVAQNGGKPRQVDSSQFEVGRNLACTPGKVVFRNELFELIQYAPQTETVFEVPLLLSPPWINKYYIMDLAPDRSFVEWAVGHGHTTFAMSYRNPDESMRDIDLDDYLARGLRAAVDAVCEITETKTLNTVGLCVGGTLSVMLLAHLAATNDERVRSATLLNTLVDFSEPGALAAFTDADAVAQLERRMAERGFLDGREMATTFDLLRGNELIWNYVANNWLMGDDPPPFDILAWNSDSTRVPEAAHSSYLRKCYGENRLAESKLEVGGTRLRLGDIGTDMYVLAAEGDHITPWKSSYATTQLLQGSETRFVLSSAGHIAGIVNPPGPKRRYRTNDSLSEDPGGWRAGSIEHVGSWWGDWAEWIATRSGERRSPHRIGSTSHRVLADAPGSYVHG